MVLGILLVVPNSNKRMSHRDFGSFAGKKMMSFMPGISWTTVMGVAADAGWTPSRMSWAESTGVSVFGVNLCRI